MNRFEPVAWLPPPRSLQPMALRFPRPGALVGLGIGLLTGIGSFFCCFASDYLPISSVVTFSNLGIAVALALLGITQRVRSAG